MTYNPRCEWCGEQENDEQGVVVLQGPEGYFHEDCWETVLDREALKAEGYYFG